MPARLLDVAQLVMVVGAIPAFFGFGLVLARTSLVPDGAVGAALATRLVIAPSLLLAAGSWWPCRDAFVIQAGMATGMNVLVLSNEHRLPCGRWSRRSSGARDRAGGGGRLRPAHLTGRQ